MPIPLVRPSPDGADRGSQDNPQTWSHPLPRTVVNGRAQIGCKWSRPILHSSGKQSGYTSTGKSTSLPSSFNVEIVVVGAHAEPIIGFTMIPRKSETNWNRSDEKWGILEHSVCWMWMEVSCLPWKFPKSRRLSRFSLLSTLEFTFFQLDLAFQQFWHRGKYLPLPLDFILNLALQDSRFTYPRFSRSLTIEGQGADGVEFQIFTQTTVGKTIFGIQSNHCPIAITKSCYGCD